MTDPNNTTQQRGANRTPRPPPPPPQQRRREQQQRDEETDYDSCPFCHRKYSDSPFLLHQKPSNARLSSLWPTWSHTPSLSLNTYPDCNNPSTDTFTSTSSSTLDDIEKQKQKNEAAPAFNIKDNPDGGTQAWLTVFGGFLTLFCSFGWLNTVGVWQAYYSTHQLSQYSSSTVSWIPSLEMFCMFFFGPWAGDFLDRFGPAWLMGVGTFLHVFGLMMTSLCTEYYQFLLAQGICSPLGVCMLFYAAMGTIPSWFLKKRAFAFGIVASGSSLGGVILPIMTQQLIDDIGYGWSMRTTAFMIFGLLIIANFTVKTRMPRMKKPLNLRAYVLPLKEVPFALVTLGGFLFVIGFMIPLNYIITEATYYGMGEDISQYLVSILNALSLFGRILPGFLADSWGKFNIMIITCYITAILILALWIPATSNLGIIFFAAAFGFFSGAFVSMCNSVIAEITEDMREIGTRTGTFYAIFAIGALISSPIGGQIISLWDGGYVGLQIFAGCMCFGGAVSITLARIKVAGISPKVKI